MLTSAVAAPAPPATSSSGNGDDIVAVVLCAVCGLSEAQFRQTGLLGCDACYRAFAPLIAVAVAELHGVTLPPPTELAKQDTPAPPPAPVPPPDDIHAPLPWPTRRAAPRPAK